MPQFVVKLKKIRNGSRFTIRSVTVTAKDPESAKAAALNLVESSAGAWVFGGADGKVQVMEVKQA